MAEDLSPEATPAGPAAAGSPTAQSPATSPRRPRGKVARLPKTVRDQLNNMLRDGLSYAGIVAKGEDTLFNQFVRQARAGQPPWNLYYRVTIADAVQLGLLDLINRTRGTALTPDQFLAGCQARAGSDEIFQQSYMCNPLGDATATIVGWAAIERCRCDYSIERLHLEDSQLLRNFGQFNPSTCAAREQNIGRFILQSFPILFGRADPASSPPHAPAPSKHSLRLGFDVAASGQGDLAVFYIDQPGGSELWLRALLTVRTDDWHFLKTVLFFFLEHLPRVQAAGDETGLGRQICWEAANQFPNRFLPVNFTANKHDLGFSLMNQLSIAEKRFPKNEQDIAADYFALRKFHNGAKWVFTEGRNSFNPASHCDIAWAGALASAAHNRRRPSCGIGVATGYGFATYDTADDP